MAGYGATVKLPCGILYPEIPNGEVSIQPMGTLEEKYFSAENLRHYEKINRLIQGCVDLPMVRDEKTGKEVKFDPMNLTIQDRFFLMWEIRILSWGPEYTFPFRCEDCNGKSVTKISMRDIPVNYMDPGKEYPFSTDLPNGDVVTWRLLTGKDEVAILQQGERLQRKVKDLKSLGDPEYIHRLALRIVTVNGEEKGLIQRMSYVEGLRGMDSLTYRDAVSQVKVGPELEGEWECSLCNYLNGPMALPISSDFFRRRLDQSADTGSGVPTSGNPPSA